MYFNYFFTFHLMSDISYFDPVWVGMIRLAYSYLRIDDYFSKFLKIYDILSVNNLVQCKI